MTPPAVLPVAGGLYVAQRGAVEAAPTPCLRVVDRAPIQVPTSQGQESLTAKGEVWRRVWVLPDRLVIAFLQLVVVEVNDTDGDVVFDRELPADMEQHLLLDHVLPLVLARRGHVVLHGAVVSRGSRAAVLLGPTGAGKSTLTAYAWRQGWTVGGDDGAVVSLGTPVTVEPTYATVRLTLESIDLLGITPEAGSEVVGKRRVQGYGAEAFQQGPVELALIAVLQPTSEAQAGFVRLRGVEAHAALFSSTFHLDLRARPFLRDTMNRLAEVAAAVVVGRLSVPRGAAGLARADQALREALLGSP